MTTALGGRPTVWTAENEAVFLEALEHGLSFTNASAAAGINPNTQQNRRASDDDWRQRGDEARARGVQRAAARVRALMECGDASVSLKATLAFLAAHDESWKPAQKIEHSGTMTLTGILSAVAAQSE